MKSGLGFVETGLLKSTDHLWKVGLLFGKFYPIQLTTILYILYVAAFVNLIFMFSRMQVHYSKVLSFETCTADIFITWKKRDANKATWPFGHSQISSERAAEHFLEFYRFKFQKTNGSSMYWIHVSYWGHIRNTISYIQLTQLGTVSPHFWGWDPTTTANVTPVETRTVTSPGRHVFLEVARALRACDFGHVGRLCREWLSDSTCGSPRKVTWKAGTYTGNEDVCPTESGDFAMAC